MVAVALMGMAGEAGSAFAGEPGEPGETMEAYLLAQQGLGHLAHDASPTGIEMAGHDRGNAVSLISEESPSWTPLARRRPRAVGRASGGEAHPGQP